MPDPTDDPTPTKDEILYAETVHSVVTLPRFDEDTIASKSNKSNTVQSNHNNDTRNLTSDLSNLLGMVSAILKARLEARQLALQKAADTSTACDDKRFSDTIDSITQMSRAIADEESLNTMSPQTKEKYVTVLKSRRKRLIYEMHDAEMQPRKKTA